MDNIQTETVNCGICGEPTTMTGTKRCDRCRELERMIQADSHLARKILSTVPVKMAKADWEEIGKKGGWFRTAADTGLLVEKVMEFGDDAKVQALKDIGMPTEAKDVKMILGRLDEAQLRSLINKLYENVGKGPGPSVTQPAVATASLQGIGWTLEKRADEAESMQ